MGFQHIAKVKKNFISFGVLDSEEFDSLRAACLVIDMSCYTQDRHFKLATNVKTKTRRTTEESLLVFDIIRRQKLLPRKKIEYL